MKAGIIKKSWDYRWCSVHAHLAGEDSGGIILPEKQLSLSGDWRTYLQETQGSSGIEFEQLERKIRVRSEIGGNYYYDALIIDIPVTSKTVFASARSIIFNNVV